MTVAAVILADTPEAALADADGVPAVRRIVDAAWSGGATPIVVVSTDPGRSIAQALAGASVTLAEPAPGDGGLGAEVLRGADVARAAVVETDAVLVWPVPMTWVGPETVTSLIELHGTAREPVLRPTWRGEPGWPSLVALDELEAMRRTPRRLATVEELADALGGDGATRAVDLGDPGVTIDLTTPRARLPDYEGPSGPPAGHVHEWGAALADTPDDAPLEGPSLAPYAPAGATDSD